MPDMPKEQKTAVELDENSPSKPRSSPRMANHLRSSKGKSFADPPIEQPLRDDLIVNLKTANAIWATAH
jgi:hypothetical protein